MLENLLKQNNLECLFSGIYSALLKKAGEVATAYSSKELEEILKTMPFSYEVRSIGNMAYVKSLSLNSNR